MRAGEQSASGSRHPPLRRLAAAAAARTHQYMSASTPSPVNTRMVFCHLRSGNVPPLGLDDALVPKLSVLVRSRLPGPSSESA